MSPQLKIWLLIGVMHQLNVVSADELDELLDLTNQVVDSTDDVIGGEGNPIGGVLKVTAKLPNRIKEYQEGKPEEKIYHKLEALDSRLQRLSTLASVNDIHQQLMQMQYDVHVEDPTRILKGLIHGIISPTTFEKRHWDSFLNMCQDQLQLPYSPERILAQIRSFTLECENSTLAAISGFVQTSQQQQHHHEKIASAQSIANVNSVMGTAAHLLETKEVHDRCLVSLVLKTGHFKREFLSPFIAGLRNHLLFLAMTDTLCLSATRGNDTDQIERGINATAKAVYEIANFVSKQLADGMVNAWPSAHEAAILRVITEMENQKIPRATQLLQIFPDGVKELKTVGVDGWHYFIVVSPNAPLNKEFFYSCFDPKYCFLIKDQFGFHIAVSRFSMNGTKASAETLKNVEAANKLGADAISPNLEKTAEKFSTKSLPTLVKKVESQLFGQSQFLRSGGYHMMVVSRRDSNILRKNMNFAYAECLLPDSNATHCLKIDSIYSGFLGLSYQNFRWLFTV